MDDNKTVKVETKCVFCGFKVVWTAKTNEHGFFEIPTAFCPNDFAQLESIVDGAHEENK